MADQFSEKLAVIEKFFGSGWLSAPKSPQFYSHPICRIWNKRRDLDGPFSSPSQSYSAAELKHSLWTLGTVLEIGPTIDAFRELMVPKLTNPRVGDAFYNYLYEAKVACWFVRAGLPVRFIPTKDREAERAADLQVESNSLPIRLECKRKMPLKPLPPRTDQKDALHPDVEKLEKAMPWNWEILVFVHDNPPSAIMDKAFQVASTLCQSGNQTEYRDTGVWVLARKLPAPLPGVRYRASLIIPFIPPNSPACSVYECIGDDQQKDQTWTNPRQKTVHLFRFSSHSFSQIRSSFESGRRKFKKDERGVVFIELDSHGMLMPSFGWYVQLMCLTLSDIAWRGKQNQRVGALGISSGVCWQHGDKDSVPFSLPSQQSAFHMCPTLERSDPYRLAIESMLTKIDEKIMNLGP